MYRKLCSQILHFPYITSLKHRKRNIIAALFSSSFGDIRKTTVAFFFERICSRKIHPSILPEYRGMYAGYTYVVLVRWDAAVCSCSELRKSPGKFAAGQWSP